MGNKAILMDSDANTSGLRNNDSLETTEEFDIHQISEFIETNVEMLLTPSNFLKIVPILHRTISLKTSSIVCSAVKTNFIDVFQKFQNSENHMKIALQLLYQIIKVLKTVGEVESSQLLLVLKKVTEIFYETKFEKIRLLTIACLKLGAEKCCQMQVLHELWIKISQTHKLQFEKNTEILVHFIEELLLWKNHLYRDYCFIEIVQKLLTSQCRNNRKSALYMLKKCLKEIESSSPTESNYSYESWLLYLAIIENLEEKQSHLILPSLEQIRNIQLEQHWLDIIFIQMLSHNNGIVARWAIEYLLRNRKACQLSDKVLEHLLEATNCTNLYNYEDYFLDRKCVHEFVDNNIYKILKLFSKINWKPVPLHFWFTELNQIKNIIYTLQNIENHLFLNLSAKIRCLQNKCIRANLQKIFETIFCLKIDSSTFNEYLTFVETLYNITDNFHSYNLIMEKIQNNKVPEELKLSHRSYMILIESTSYARDSIFEECLLEAYDKIPSELHGYFRIMAIFDFSKTEKQLKFCKNHYNYDFAGKILSLDQFQNQYSELFLEKNEKLIIQEKVIDAFIASLNSISQLEDHGLCIQNILDIGGVKSLNKLCQLLGDSKKSADSITMHNLISKLQKHIKNEVYLEKIISNILVYAGEQRDCIAETILKLNGENLIVCAFLLRNAFFSDDLILDGLFSGILHTGDQRIERLYSFRNGFGNTLSAELIRSAYRNYILEHHQKLGPEYTKNIYNKLIERTFNISKNNSLRYFENSMPHRLKLRTVATIANMCSYCNDLLYDERLWIPILEENNQFNITHMYERIIAYTIVDSCKLLVHLEKMSSYSSSRKLSIINIAFMFCMLKKNAEFAKTLIHILLPATMGACYNVRLRSQLVIYNLITNFAWNELFFGTIRNAICEALRDQILILSQDICFSVTKETFLRTDIIFYVTNAPFDEYISAMTDGEIKQNEQSKQLFSKKAYSNNSVSISPFNTRNIQRKNNPINLTNLELITYGPQWIKAQNIRNNIVVVASLIDNLPNIGGIARTCEVFGIKNLVVGSLKHTESEHFKNVSMTAEKYLDIMEVKATSLTEFLLQKKIEGFQIVGAEQTAYSKNFVDFQFPAKCVLLLGHEKEGISANLLPFLDSAVEIPQLGLVRSLNVHVAAALFLWEYCKQHILGRPS